MKILIISGYSHTSIGGAEKYIREVINIGIKRKYIFHELYLLENYKSVCEEKCSSELIATKINIKYRNNKLLKFLDYIIKRKKINKLIKTNLFDLVLINGTDISIKRKFLGKCVFIQHSNNSYYEKLYRNKVLKYLNINTISWKAKNIVCFSDASIEKFKIHDLKNNRNYFKIPLFINFSEKPFVEKNDIVYIGRFSEEKGIDKILEISKYLKEPIHLYGAGPYKINNSENIINHGYIDSNKVSDVLNMAKLNVLFSKSEGLPFSLIEGFSQGTPCLILNSFTNAEFLVNNGKNGFLLDEKTSVNNIADVINNFDLSRFSVKGIQQFAKHNFSYENFYLNWTNLFSLFE